jgi:prepilin-type N-terminal cleavage/methylation domain-containing protein
MPMKRRMHNLNQQGFTLVELVMVVVIIGILAAMAAPRMSLTDSSVHAQAAQIARDIRHAQMLAMTQGRTLIFQSLGGSYRCTDSTSTIITDPATQQPFTFTLSNGVTLTATSVSFDSLGRPVSAGVLRSTAVNYTASGGGQSAALSVSPVTGFVTVTP